MKNKTHNANLSNGWLVPEILIESAEYEWYSSTTTFPAKHSFESWYAIAKAGSSIYGPLARYTKLRAVHAPGMPGTFSPSTRVSDPDMHHGTCVTHVPRRMSESLTSGFLWSRWRGKRSRHSRRMRNPQFCVSGKRSICVNDRGKEATGR